MPYLVIGLLVLLIFLILIVISVCIYPFICVSIATVCKKVGKIDNIVTCALLLITIALYLYACTTLEYSFDDWCYSVYGGVVLTPISLFICTGVKSFEKWLESKDRFLHKNNTIPIVTFFTSLIFAIEGVLRMTHSNSIHILLRNGFVSQETESYFYYFDEFQYAGSILFFVSLVSALIIGFVSLRNYKEINRMQKELNKISQSLKEDLDLLNSIEPQQFMKLSHCYNSFCHNIIAALVASDEKNSWSFNYGFFNGIKTSDKVLLLSNNDENKSYYFYTTGIVTKDSNDIYKYIPIRSMNVSIKKEQKETQTPLPNEIQPIRQYWRYTCRDGSPDLRFSYNPKTYVYAYSNLWIGITEIMLHVYRANTAKEVFNSFNELNFCLSQIKVEKSQKKTIEEVTTVASDIISNDEVVTSDRTLTVEDKPSYQQVAIDSPKTLEECFYDIILRRGKDVLTDNNIVNIISSSYKDVDIKEYKELLDRMVNDKFLYQFIELEKQKDFALYNITSSYARQNKLNVQTSLFIVQALVKAIKKTKQ